MLSSLEYSDIQRFRPILKKLDEIHVELEMLQQKKNSVGICDALAKQQEVYEAVLYAIKNGCFSVFLAGSKITQVKETAR